MLLAPIHFTKIEGTAVSVNMASTEEAKAAQAAPVEVLACQRGALVRQQKAARSRKKWGKRPKSFLSRLIGGTRWLFNAIIELPRCHAPGVEHAAPLRFNASWNTRTQSCIIFRAASCRSKVSC
jgi:hypothetical protein